MKREQVIAPQSAAAFELKAGERLRVVDLAGGQVADLLAFNPADHRERLSTGATIDQNSSLYLRRGDRIYSNRYNPMLQLVEDTAGAHDLLHPPCSPEMYRCQYGVVGEHPSCYANFVLALKKYGIDESLIATPFNIFMNTRVCPDGRVVVKEPLSGPGDYVLLAAEMDLIVAVTACSVEQGPCNASRCTAIKMEVFSGPGS